MAGWWLVRREPLDETLNHAYADQDRVLGPAPPDHPRRRSAAEIAFDTLLWERVHGERLLAAASLVVLLLWVYYSAQILLVGAEFTEVYSRRYGSRREDAAE